jgi:phage terminase small subunit
VSTPKIEVGIGQERFIQEYLIDPNATKAAIRAGYSAKTARVVGCRNITKANI